MAECQGIDAFERPCCPAISSSNALSSSALDGSQYQGLFQCVICSHQMTKILELHFSISLSSEYSELISLNIDRFDILAVQGTSGVYSSITVQRHQFLGILPFLFHIALLELSDYTLNRESEINLH